MPKELTYDETEENVTTSYVTTAVSSWKIMKYRKRKASHAVVDLLIDLKNKEKLVECSNGWTMTTLKIKKDLTEKNLNSKLNVFCSEDAFAKESAYCEVPKHDRWKKAFWAHRKNKLKLLEHYQLS